MTTVSSLWRRLRHDSHSIRWRLPLTYALIALVAAIVLSGILLITLRDHYHELEREYLQNAVRRVVPSAEQVYVNRDGVSDVVFQSTANTLAFFSSARVRLLDIDQQVIADSSNPVEPVMITVGAFRPAEFDGNPPPPENQTYFTLEGELTMLPGTPMDTGNFTIPANGFAPETTDNGRPYVIGQRRPSANWLLDAFASQDTRADLVMRVPLTDSQGELLGYLEMSESPAFGNDIIRDVAQKAIVAGALAVLLAGIAGWIISRRISQPVLSLAETTQRMADGDLSARVALDRRDEFGLLARTFNGMAARVENTVLTLKHFVADAAHEINTPLTALRTNLELAAAGTLPEQSQADIARAQIELERLETLTTSLLTLSRLDGYEHDAPRDPVDLVALAQRKHEQVASRAEQAQITVTLDIPAAPVMVLADEQQLGRVLDNLLDNALKFTPPEGMITLRVAQEAGRIALAVSDTGIGIPESDLPKLFSRFHRGRNTAAYAGNGLGLAITRRIVEDHGGTITATSCAGETQFYVHLPEHSPAEA